MSSTQLRSLSGNLFLQLRSDSLQLRSDCCNLSRQLHLHGGHVAAHRRKSTAHLVAQVHNLHLDIAHSHFEPGCALGQITERVHGFFQFLYAPNEIEVCHAASPRDQTVFPRRDQLPTACRSPGRGDDGSIVDDVTQHYQKRREFPLARLSKLAQLSREEVLRAFPSFAIGSSTADRASSASPRRRRSVR